MQLFQSLKNLLERGHKRSVVAKKNILLSIIYKVVGMGIGFAYYPLMLHYLNKTQFGIFVTLESIIDWFAFMDIGIGRGLRNKVGVALAKQDTELARSYVSTAYFIIGGIFLILVLLFVSLSHLVDWSNILNSEPEMRQELTYLVIAVFIAFSVRFVSSLVYEVFNAMQRTSMLDLFNMVAKVGFLLAILLLISSVPPSLLYFGITRSFAFAVVPLAVAFYYFRAEFRHLAPSIKHFALKHARSLTSLGVQFFVIQIALLVINQTNNYLILKLIHPDAVAPYASAFKYLSIVVIGFSIASNPLWAAYIEAYEKRDFPWVRATIRKMIKIWVLLSLLMAVMIAISPWVYEIWLGGEVTVPYSLSILVGLMVMIANWNTIFNLFINGTGKIRVQMYTTLLVGLINIPLCILLVRVFDLGTNGVVIGSILSILLIALVSPIQVWKILNGSASGIWDK